MQVTDPKQFERSRKRRKARRWYLYILAVAVVFLVGFSVYKWVYSPPQSASDQKLAPPIAQSPTKTGKLKTFSGEEFKNLYNSIAYPNTQQIDEETPITGDKLADLKIQSLAKARGYLPRSAPVADNLKNVGSNNLLQQRAAQAWQELKSVAKKDGHSFGLPAAYRSAVDQKAIFLQRLKTQNIPVVGIASGKYDSQINQVLRTTAVPGYSRHHTGYTIDIACESNLVNFENSTCFKWLSKNNYKNAKKYGWIPSYPAGAGLQGPDPEAWEYVWVGKDAVTE